MCGLSHVTFFLDPRSASEERCASFKQALVWRAITDFGDHFSRIYHFVPRWNLKAQKQREALVWSGWARSLGHDVGV